MYIWDYCQKRNFKSTAAAFVAEAGISTDQPIPINAPEGFLYEWWTVFWDVFSARTGGKEGSKDALTYIEV